MNTRANWVSKVAEHAGYQRAIINKNPPLVDDEGYELDSDDNEERVQEVVASAMEDNPYSSIHLERLLAPLTAVTGLPTHPTLSRPFTSKALTELVNQSSNLMHKENTALWKVKPLLTKLIGDNIWAPCETMIQPNDYDLFTDTARFLRRTTSSSPAAIDAPPNPNDRFRQITIPETPFGQPRQESGEKMDVDPPLDADKGKGKEKEHANGETLPEETTDNNKDDAQVNGNIPPKEGGGGDPIGDDGPSKNKDVGLRDVNSANSASLGNKVYDNGSGSNRVNSVAPEPTIDGEFFIHPLFVAPSSAHPDRDFGLPESEAEDMRRLLQLYVQKQEEVARGTKKLYEGLLKADRLRKTVMQWAKAEAHCGPNRDMSDGEDWYDKEEWGLTEDLKKGEDEVEEDTAQTQKKTRTRR
ncbi:RXT2-like protein [Bombardia bombarda]|uniref:RXT2-like protein n=1 Tax=Bombardia bombarda TaxID=252184 RepID=A0AA39X8N2_9PEZI|nr:RXT2-like protein [Bombardia bombarda]